MKSSGAFKVGIRGIKFMKIKSLSVVFTCLLFTIPMSSAYAGELVTPNVTVTWDDNSIYKTKQLVGQVYFKINANSTVRRLEFSIVNKYGDKISNCLLASMPSTGHSCDFFGNNDYEGTVLNLYVLLHSNSTSTYQSPIIFLDRNKPVATSSTQPTTPTDELSTLKAQIKQLQNKINKICKSKPKPKGC